MASPASLDSKHPVRALLHGFEAKVLAAFTLALLVVAGLAASTWKLAQDAVTADRWVSHSQDVLTAVAQTEFNTLQIELSMQGFRVTGNPQRLAERDAARAARQATLATLGEMTRDNPPQQQRLQQLNAVLKQRQALANQIEHLVKTQGFVAASAFVAASPLAQTRQQASQILAAMQAEERSLLAQRLRAQGASRDGLLRLGFTAASALGALLLATLILIRRQLQATRTSQRALAASEESYATTLLSIGDAVMATDTQARITRMNRVAEQLTGWPLTEAQGRLIGEVFNVVHEITRTAAVIPVDEVLATGEIREIANHTVLISRQGREYPIADSAAPIRDTNGRFQGVVLVFRDVTREHLAEQMVREQAEQLEQRVQERTRQLIDSEVRYKTAFMTNPDPVILTRLPDGLYLDINDGFVRTFGWTREQVLGRTATDLGIWHHPACRAGFVQALAEHGACDNFEAEFLSASGQVLICLVSAKVITVHGQTCLLSVVRDISERKRAENALAASEQELRLLAEAMPQIVWIADAQGNSVYVNQQWADYTGRPLSDYYGQGWNQALHPDDRQRTRDAWAHALKHQQTYTQENRMRRFDGQYGWWLVRAVPVQDGHGKLAKWFGTSTLIDELKRTEMALRQSEERLNFAMERSQIASWDIDIEGGEIQRSQGHDQIFGYPDKLRAWSHSAFLDHVLAQDRPLVAQKFVDAIENGSDLNVECRIQAFDATQRWIWTCGGARTDADGRPHLAGIIQDISQRKSVEEELKRYRDHLQDLVAARTQELVEAKKTADMANLAKSHFLANMSHEIRTPLGAISGMSRLVRREPLSPGQQGYLDKLETAASHLNSTINDILDLSKIEAGKLDLQDEPVQLGSLIANVVDMCQASAMAKKLSVTGASAPLPAQLYGDPTRLRQALLNYLGNAVKFTDSGSIQVSARLVDESAESVLIRLTVQDSGIGIEADKLDKVFRAFEQADSSTSRRYGGTGLGLAITKKLAQAMGGDAGATSTLGQGSCFWLTVRLRKGLPVVAQARAEDLQNPADRLRELCRGKRVLLVDDDDFNREIGQIVLGDVGLQVDLAEDGHGAVELASQTSYDLILMDMQMPRLDGLDATRIIRQSAQGSSVPIVAMTANAFAEDKAQCLAAGMNDFITKPFDPQVLYRTMLFWMLARPAAPAPAQVS
jgi:PAS domain S-box-containing protein